MLDTDINIPAAMNLMSERSHSAHEFTATFPNFSMKLPQPPRLWITDISSVSSDDDDSETKEEQGTDRPRVRSRFRSHKLQKASSIPLGIFWDIENCQVPRGCSAIDVVSAIRAKFLVGRREADFVVVCDVKKESSARLQELNDAQVSLIHVCGTQKNAADEKLRQCMRRFGELHSAPAALLLISGDINFAGDLSDFRHRKNMEVILVHKKNTSCALIACASSHHCYNALTALLPRNQKSSSQSEPESESHKCEIEVDNLPLDRTSERLSRRLRRLADNCGGKVLRVTPPTALLRFPTPDHASRALKRMDGEDVFGNKIVTRGVRGASYVQTPGGPVIPQYSSDEGYGTALPSTSGFRQPQILQRETSPVMLPTVLGYTNGSGTSELQVALQQLPLALLPKPVHYPGKAGLTQPRQIRGAHSNQETSSASGDELQLPPPQPRAVSPWNSSSFSEQSSEGEAPDNIITELSVANLPNCDPHDLHNMLLALFTHHVPVLKVLVRVAADGPIATVTLQSESDARLAIARLHRRRLEGKDWAGRRLELSLGRSSPTPSVDVIKGRLRRLLMDHPGHTLPLLRLRDAYASRHACALTSSDLARVRDTVIVHEGFGRMVQLISKQPAPMPETEEAPWKCKVHCSVSSGHEDGSRILMPVYIELATLANNVQRLLETHNGIVPLLSFVECYEATFEPLVVEGTHGVALEVLLRSIPSVALRQSPSRHLSSAADRRTPSPVTTQHGENGERGECHVAPALAPLLALLERELLDLLKTAPRCSIPFSKFIPAYHHHFGRQLRVADYGFTKLPELLAVLSSTVVVLGSGSSRVITLSYSAQSRRWTNDLVKLVKLQPTRYLHIKDLPQLYLRMYVRHFIPADYGVCTLPELMNRVAAQAVIICPDGNITLPRREPTQEELARTIMFSNEAIELLCHTPNLRMEFSRFVPAYHAHFGRQCRVAYYGCTKLAELFDLIPTVVTIRAEPNSDRTVRLSLRPARAVMVDRLRVLSSVPLQLFSKVYADSYGAPPQPDALDADSIEGLIFAAGGYIENGIVRAPGEAPFWVNQMLTACAVLSADRSVAARGSSAEYFIAGFKERTGFAPPVENLVLARVIKCVEGRVVGAPEWRAAWRTALILSAQPGPMNSQALEEAYYMRYEMQLPFSEVGFESTVSFLRHFRELFSETACGRYSLCAGVCPTLLQDKPRVPQDFSLLDTPPGQKGSRVFDTPPQNIWSPPASALPAPNALLAQDNKRRTRLAAQFGLTIPTEQ